jgi:hypothetical protein
MLRKLIVFAITSGLAAKLYRRYVSKREGGDVAVSAPVTQRRRAGTQTSKP